MALTIVFVFIMGSVAVAAIPSNTVILTFKDGSCKAYDFYLFFEEPLLQHVEEDLLRSKNIFLDANIGEGFIDAWALEPMTEEQKNGLTNIILEKFDGSKVHYEDFYSEAIPVSEKTEAIELAIAKINAIGNPAELKLEDKARVVAARNAVEAAMDLGAEETDIINLDCLLAAEKKIEALEAKALLENLQAEEDQLVFLQLLRDNLKEGLEINEDLVNEYKIEIGKIDPNGISSTDEIEAIIISINEAASVIKVTLELSTDIASPGDSITAAGTADPNNWVSIKIIDEVGSIVFFDATKSDVSGNYSLIFRVPNVPLGTVLTVVAGYGNNVATKELLVVEDTYFDELWTAFATTINEQGQTNDPKGRVTVQFNPGNKLVNIKILDSYHSEGISQIAYGTGISAAITNLLKSEKVVKISSAGYAVETLDVNGNKKADDELQDDSSEVAFAWLGNNIISTPMDEYLIGQTIDFILYGKSDGGKDFSMTYQLYFY